MRLLLELILVFGYIYWLMLFVVYVGSERIRVIERVVVDFFMVMFIEDGWFML